jgi:ATP-dependent exoDNAse (exonuclease V) beta subunit
VAAEHSVEVPFMVATERARLLAGVIDLIHQEPAGWMITDYKTDAESSAERANAHAMQLESYQKALALCALAVAGARLTPVRR